MADISDAPRSVGDPPWRTIEMRRGRPGRPFGARAAPATRDHPAQQVGPAVRRRARRIEEADAVEVIGYRPVVVARPPGRPVAPVASLVGALIWHGAYR